MLQFCLQKFITTFSENEGGDVGETAAESNEGLEEEEEEAGEGAGGEASSKEYLEEAEDDSYLGANQDILEGAEEGMI